MCRALKPHLMSQMLGVVLQKVGSAVRPVRGLQNEVIITALKNWNREKIKYKEGAQILKV